MNEESARVYDVLELARGTAHPCRYDREQMVTLVSADIPTSKLHGHTYSGTLTGNAVFSGVIVATVGPNATLYKYP